MLVALDFESEAIDSRPKYPPNPVGCAVKFDNGKPGFYYGWGHPTKNNYDLASSTIELASFIEDPNNELIFHNAPFDCSIFEERLNIPIPWHRVHDTMLLAFLANPFGELSLKPLAEELLGEPPTERDAVRDWLVQHGVCRSNDKQWGAYISKAPGDLVGTYAIGDVERTLKVFKHFMSGGTGSYSFNGKVTMDRTSGVGGRNAN